MKASTVNSLITARSLYDESMKLIDSDDRHMCSAGLVILQDALEIIFLGLLTELGIDEQKALESKGFDELIGELRKTGITIPKSGVLKSMNKQRVITKHYGQLAEPITVRTYAEAAEFAIAEAVQQVLGRSLSDIFLTDLLDQESESKDLLAEAAKQIEKELWLDALIEIRKALFVEIEHEHSIHGWKDVDAGEIAGGLLGLRRGGEKALYWTKNRKWIDEHVKDPLDYVQVDHQRLRLDAMEWGVNTAELENLRRLTPEVFRAKKGDPWHIKHPIDFPANEATSSNARYCLDRAISILIRKQQHARARRWPRKEAQFNPPDIYLDAPVYSRATCESDIVHNIDITYTYQILQKVTGFNPEELFLEISATKKNPDSILGFEWISGFLMINK